MILITYFVIFFIVLFAKLMLDLKPCFAFVFLVSYYLQYTDKTTLLSKIVILLYYESERTSLAI